MAATGQPRAMSCTARLYAAHQIGRARQMETSPLAFMRQLHPPARMHHLYAVALLLLAAAPATAQRVDMDTPADPTQWQEAFAGPAGALYIDTRHARRTGDTILAWTWVAYTEVVSDEGTPPYDRILAYDRYDCRARTTTLLQIALFRDGTSVLEQTADAPQEVGWVPETEGHLIGESVCGIVR